MEVFKKSTPKTDCFAYSKRQNKEGCRALNEFICSEQDTCPFYKPETDELNHAAIEKAILRYNGPAK